MSACGIFRVQPTFLAATVLCLAASTNACSSEPQALHSHPIPGCEMHDIAPCDTKTRACQQSRFEFAACLRGAVGGAPPPLTLITEEDYVAYVNGTSEGRDLPTNHFEIAMTWLGLAQHGSFNFVPVTKESIADWFGTYRWRQRDLLVIDHGRPADDVASNVALVKAMIRALRDRDIQVGTWTTVVSVNDVDSNWGSRRDVLRRSPISFRIAIRPRSMGETLGVSTSSHRSTLAFATTLLGSARNHRLTWGPTLASPRILARAPCILRGKGAAWMR